VLVATAALVAPVVVSRALSRALGVPVSIGSVWIGPRADLTLSSVRIAADAGGPSIARVEIDPDARRLVRGDLVINRVLVTGLVATAVLGADGAPALRGMPLSGGAGGRPPVDVREIVVRESDVDLPEVPGVAEIADVGRRGGRGLGLHLDRLVLRQVPTSASPGVVAWLGSARGDLAGMPLTADASAEVGGEVGAGARAIDATATIADVPIDAVEVPGLPALRRLGGRVAARARYQRERASGTDRLDADLQVSNLGLATESGVTLAARRASASGIEVDFARDRGWRMRAIELEGATLSLAAHPGAVRAEIAVAALRDVARGAPGRLEVTAHPSGGGTVRISGRLGLEPVLADVATDLETVPLTEAVALLPRSPLSFTRGAISGRLETRADAESLRASGVIEVDDVHTAPPDPTRPNEVLAASRIEARLAFDGGGPSPHLSLPTLTLEHPYAMIVRRPDGSFPLAAAPRSQVTGDSDGDDAALTVEIADLRLRDGRVDFLDETLDPIHWAGFSSVSASAAAIRWPKLHVDRLTVMAQYDELSPLGLSASFGEPGPRGTLNAEGLSLETLSPYLAPLLGFRADSGAMTLAVAGSVRDRNLEAEGTISLDGLDLVQTGLDVVGAATGVPLQVAAALLKDHRGTIDLSVSAAVDLDTGELRLGSILSQALTRAVLSAISAPLRLLGLLFGTDGPPHAMAIDPVPFPSASARLDADGQRRIEQIGRVLVAHDDLLLIAKSQLSAADRAPLGASEQEALATERADAIRGALMRAGRGAGGEGPARGEPIDRRIIVAPWTPDENPGGDPISGVYVELQPR
jgi:Domain of Unknown Function (DUF748)